MKLSELDNEILQVELKIGIRGKPISPGLISFQVGRAATSTYESIGGL